MNFVSDKIDLQSKREKSPQGFLLIRDNKLARTGVLVYGPNEVSPVGRPESAKNNKVRVYRSPESLLTQDTAAGFDGKPFVVLHRGMLDAKNAPKVTSGAVFNVRVQDGALYGDLTIFDAAAVLEIESGKKLQLSLGYTCDCRWAPGVTEDGEPYDAVFENYRGNHVALVPAGRCGTECRVADAALETEKGKPMIKLKIGGAEFEPIQDNAEAIQAAFDAELAKVSAPVQDSGEVAKLQAKVDGLTEEVTSLKAQKIQDAASLDKLVEDRASLIQDARKVLGAAYDCKGKDNLKIMQDALLKQTGKDMSGKSADYITARYEGMMESVAAGTAGVFKEIAAVQDSKKVEVLPLSERARQAKIEANRKKNQEGK